MEESKNKTIEQQIQMKTILVIGGACVMGCIAGIINANKVSMDSYKRGVYDTLDAILIRGR